MSRLFDFTPSLFDLAVAFNRRGLLDRPSARSLPARMTTLARRVVKALPEELRMAVEEEAPPPRRGDATPYAIALLDVDRAATDFDAEDPHQSILRLGSTLERLVRASDRPSDEVSDELRGAFVTHALAGPALTENIDHPRLLQLLVALASEGLAARHGAACRAASRLAFAAAHVPNYKLALHYVELAHAWYDGSNPYCAIQLIRVACAAGEFDRAVEVGSPLVALLDTTDDLGPYPAIELCEALADAHSERGEHDLAIERAGYAVWRAECRYGADARETNVAQEVLSDVLAAAGRVPDAVDVLEGALERRRRVIDDQPHAVLSAGCKLVHGYASIGRFLDAVTLGRELVATAESRLAYTDPLLRDLRYAVERAERASP